MQTMLTAPPQLVKTLAQTYERHGARAIQAVQLLLTIAIAAALAQLFWALMPTPESARWQPAPVVPPPAAHPAGSKLDTILAARLFGLYQAQPGNLAAAPDTRLNLTLMGIFAGDRKSESRAVIAQQNGDEQPYAIGDQVVNGVSLQAIFPDRVILSRNGALETLKLDKDKPSGDFVATGSTYNTATANQIAQARQEMLQDPNKAAEYIRVQPVNESGKMRGYRVYPGQNQALFNTAGLRPGDLVTSVNGIELDDTQKALQMLNDLSKASSVTVVVERAGQPQTLNVSFN
ncbi:MAG: type II secretion system protein GspC [Nevskiaceae bacterium]|nr:MAG: type II secretion system protein GspC [Nevskiaceae bacterium]